jgi:hypothetical protein
MSSAPQSSPRPRAARIVVVGALLLVALTILVAAVASQRNNSEGEHALPPAVVALIPAPGDVRFRQDAIGAALAVDYKGALAIDGRDIPLDQLQVDELGSSRRISFQPGPDRVFSTLSPGPHHATVYWWPETQRAPDSYAKVPSYTWSFKLE